MEQCQDSVELCIKAATTSRSSCMGRPNNFIWHEEHLQCNVEGHLSRFVEVNCNSDQRETRLFLVDTLQELRGSKLVLCS